MKNSELQFDRSCHVLYSNACQKQIQAKIALHYQEDEREAVWERVQRQYAAFLSDWRTDLGGGKNFHNGVDGTYDCIAIMSYYAVCRDVVSFREIEEIEENLILPTFRKLSKFVDCNKPVFKKSAKIKDVGAYFAVSDASKEIDAWSSRLQVTSRGYMLGYNDLRDPSVSGFFRFLARVGDGMMKIQIVKIRFGGNQ